MSSAFFWAASLAIMACGCSAAGTRAVGDVSVEAQTLATDWAPLVWIHSEDPYYPSNIDWYMTYNTLNNATEFTVQATPTPSTILSGEPSRDYHLQSIEPCTDPYCVLEHFSGQQLEEITTHIMVVEHGDACNTIDVSYPTFYPYNWGKPVCVGLEFNVTGQINCHEVGDYIHGEYHVFGSHISDWEHTEIRFQNGKPTKMYIAVHSMGARYAFNETTNEFQLEYGEPLNKAGIERAGVGEPEVPEIPVEYPERVVLVEGTHPEVFSANGSHGTWAAPGKHTYFQFVIHLDDFTDRGEAWRLWEGDMVFLDRSVPDEDYDNTDWQWINFKGRWGNIEKMGCDPWDPLFGECEMGGGVGGPGPAGNLGDYPPVCP